MDNGGLMIVDSSFEDVRLVLVGGCRNSEDEKRVEELKRIAADLGMEDRVIFEVNVIIKNSCYS